MVVCFLSNAVGAVKKIGYSFSKNSSIEAEIKLSPGKLILA